MPVTNLANGNQTLQIEHDDAVLAPDVANKIIVSVQAARTQINTAIHNTANVYARIGSPGISNAFYETMAGSFRIEAPQTAEDRSKLSKALARILRCLQNIRDGLASDPLVLVQNAAEHAQTVRGYVERTKSEGVAMLFQKASHSFDNVTELSGDIHMNFDQNQRDFAWYLTHEATHKYSRTDDHVYYNGNDMVARRAMYQALVAADPTQDLNTLMQRDPDYRRILDTSSTKLQNNADSFAHYVAVQPAAAVA